MTILKKIWDKIRPMTREEREHEWLSKSSDLVELERRQKKTQSHRHGKCQ